MTPDSLPDAVPADVRARIVEHRAVAPNHRHMRMEAPRIAASAQPGHFVQMRVADAGEPFLRRPMSLGDADPDRGTIDVLYRVSGNGTALLSSREAGDEISVMGPLGRPFDTPTGGRIALVGGGVGMPPLHFAASRADAARIVVAQGARTGDLLLYREEFAQLGIETRVATDDGSVGERGQVTALLRQLLETGCAQSILSCGPTPMLMAVAALAREFDVPCQVSIEEHMACGIGICMGCAVRNADSATPTYSLVCTDGPVFDATKVFAAE